MDDELWELESTNVKNYVDRSSGFPETLKFFLKRIQSDDIEGLEKLKAHLERLLQIVLDSISYTDKHDEADTIKNKFPLTIACNDSEKEFYSILLSYVESRISEKKT